MWTPIKIIPKGQGGLVTQSDNTRVAKPIIQEKVLYKLKPNEFYFIDKKTGKRIIGRSKQEVVSSDNRNTKQRKQDQTRAKQIQKKQEADKNYEKGIETINSLTKLTLPSTYIGPVFNNNGKSYLDNVISGEGTGNAAGNLAIDLLTPLAVGGTKSLATRLFPKSITREAMKDVHNYVSSPDYLAQDFVKRNKSPYSIDIANHMYGLDESLNFVDYRAMNDYGRVFNERIKKTLPLAKQRGTLRIDKNPTIIVADSQGRQFLQNRFFEELNKVNGIHYGDPITPTGTLAKKYYYKTSPAKDVFDIDPASFADRKNNTIVLVPSSGDYENMYKYTLPHEKTHIFIDGRKEVALFGDDRGFGALPRRDGYIDIDLDLYLNRPDEQLARGTQIKNYLGIVDESPITPEQLKYAAQNYVKDTGYDNNMTDFFRSIKDYKKAAKWLSLAPSVSPIIKTYSND